MATVSAGAGNCAEASPRATCTESTRTNGDSSAAQCARAVAPSVSATSCSPAVTPSPTSSTMMEPAMARPRRSVHDATREDTVATSMASRTAPASATATCGSSSRRLAPAASPPMKSTSSGVSTKARMASTREAQRVSAKAVAPSGRAR